MADTPPAKRVLGVNIAAGVAYLALVETPDSVLAEADRLTPSNHLVGAERLADFAARAGQHMRDLHIVAVGVVHPVLYQWKYSDAFERVSLETCILLQARDQGIICESVAQHAAARSIGVPLPKIEQALLAKVNGPRPTYWPKRCLAVLAGLAVARSISS